MGTFVFLVCLGCMMPAVGSLLVCTSIPPTSWDASWEEFKDAFNTIAHKRRFQAGSICIAVGMLIVFFIFASLPL